MGKNEFLTPKAIGNRIKAKGLQKLRWYCQMCQKQCRDENGFKCHQNSESHKRQMEVFGQNPGRVIYGYTEEFEKGFMELLRRAHPNTRVAAKVVYNEYIADRHHVHMNSTKWLTLSEFVQHLGETGQCRIENTPKGWFISLIKEEDKIERERRLKRERAEKGEEERNRAMIESQVKRARTDGAEDVSGALAGSELQRGEDGEAVKIALAGPSRLKPALLEAKPDPQATKAFAESDRGNRVEGSANGHSQPVAQKRKTAIQAVMEQEEQMKQMKAQRAAAAAPPALLPTAEVLKKAGDKPWLHKRIIVKVLMTLHTVPSMVLTANPQATDQQVPLGLIRFGKPVVSKSLRDTAYYKKKALVRKIVDGFIGEVEMLDSGDVLRIDQRELETVLPDIGKPVLVVSGADKGEEAMMKAIHTADFVAEIKLKTGRHAGQSVKLPYESICKLQKA